MGWFGSIKEIEGAALIKGMSVKDFAKEYLIREWWVGDEDIYVPAPRKNFSRYIDELKEVHKFYKKHKSNLFKEQHEKNGKGFKVASWGHNLMSGYACIFLTKDQKCGIHASKPRECKRAFACQPATKNDINIREKIVKYWAKHQDYVNKLLEN
jgi:Fe-S-cluster containining protein